MDAHQLSSFLAVVDHGSVTKAAAATHVAQPSLSQVIRKLEKDLKVELFRRVGRGLVLTPAGEALIGPARQIIRDMQQARQVAQGFLGLEGGRLDLALTTSLTSNFIAAWIGDYRRKYPGITVRLTQHDGPTSDLVHLVRSGEAEIAFSLDSVTRNGVACDHLADGELILAVPPMMAAVLPDPVAFDQLTDLPFVLNRGAGHEEFAATLYAQGFDPRVVVEVNESSALVPLVAAGAGAAFLPMRQALDARRRGAVLRATNPTLTRAIYAIMPKTPLSVPAQAFLELSRKHLDTWRRSIESGMAEGASLLSAAIETDQVIEEAYARLSD